MKNITTRQVIDIILILLLLIFVVQNIETVKIKFLLYALDLPFIILIVIVFFIGFYTAKVFNLKDNTNKND